MKHSIAHLINSKTIMTLSSFFAKSTSQTKSKYAALELLILSLCLFLPKEGGAHILVYRSATNQLIEDYNDMPAQFGPGLPSNGLKVFAIAANPIIACGQIDSPNKSDYPDKAKFVAIIERGGGKNCTFELKVRTAQKYLYDAAIVYNNESDDLETMSAVNTTGIRIPSVFVGLNTGIALRSFYTNEIVIVINDELPFNINTQLILPFSIFIGICFLVMIFYMIYKCIREERRLSRNRLPKSMLKKLPILKYTKNGDIRQENCVICIEDYVEGDKLRVLPCKHVYHTHCIDPWLTENRRVCPMCKRKVFTRGESRTNRNRPVSLDSGTDTDDDTAPLLQPTTDSNNSSSGRGGRRSGRQNRRNNARNLPATDSNETTSNNTSTIVVPATGANNSETETQTSDEENALLTQQSPVHNARRVNPFDRRPNLPPHLADQLNSSNQRSFWSYPILRLFRRQQPTRGQILRDARSVLSVVNSPVATSIPPTQITSSANATPDEILSNSFREDDEIPHQSIYEPIGTVTPTPIPTPTVQTNAENINRTTNQDNDSVFIQTPVQGGIGVVALPNTAFTTNQSGATGGSTSTTEPRFWV